MAATLTGGHVPTRSGGGVLAYSISGHPANPFSTLDEIRARYIAGCLIEEGYSRVEVEPLHSEETWLVYVWGDNTKDLPYLVTDMVEARHYITSREGLKRRKRKVARKVF